MAKPRGASGYGDRRRLIIVDDTFDAVWKLNPANGVATQLVPDGVFASTRWGVFVTQDSRILVPGQLVGESDYAIYEVDPATGSLSVFASGGAIAQPYDVLVVETRPCDDGEDNDGDGTVDWDGGIFALPIDPQCADRPWKNREGTGCGLGFELVFLLPPLSWLRRRGRAGRNA